MGDPVGVMGERAMGDPEGERVSGTMAMGEPVGTCWPFPVGVVDAPVRILSCSIRPIWTFLPWITLACSVYSNIRLGQDGRSAPR